jgi:hypothetical protein
MSEDKGWNEMKGERREMMSGEKGCEEIRDRRR